MPIGNRNWKSAGALTAFVLMLFTTVSVPEMTVNAGNSYAASGSAAATADERKNETSLTNELCTACRRPDGRGERAYFVFQKRGRSPADGEHDEDHDLCFGTGNWKSGGRPAGFFLCGEAAEGTYGRAEGEYYRMEDLLYGLMLESYNDAAVVIAEYYGSKAAGLSMDCSLHTEEESRKAVLTFARKMNEKAKEIGCENTFFITPNGLDAELETDGTQKQHSCTATDLAAIMRYCAFMSPQKETFLTITRTASRQFCSLKKAQDGTFETGTRTVSAANHNAFLQMMDGMLSGKTGFTGKAGYCYVGALTKGKKSFTIALLACGWPNNRTWKWHDARLLLEYGLEAFDQRSLQQPDLPKTLLVENGQLAEVSLNCPKKEIRMLLSRGDQTDVRVSLPGQLTAPVEAGEQVGTVSYLVNGALYEQLPVTAAFGVPKITYCYCLKRLLALVLL